MTRPRYQILAEQLREQITDGTFPPGSHLPTELELCDQTGMSRHTVREAMRMLREGGLIARRQGIGTVVLSQPGPRAFEQSLDGIDSLLQYAVDAPLIILSYEELTATETEAKRFNATIDRTYVLAEGLRRQPETDASVGLTRILMRGDIAPPEEALGGLSGSIVSEMERQGRLTIGRIDQRITATTLNKADSTLLEVATESATLFVRRIYYDRDDRVAVASETFHPEGRFAYHQIIHRSK